MNKIINAHLFKKISIIGFVVFVSFFNNVRASTIVESRISEVPDFNRDRIEELMGLKVGDQFTELEADKGLKRLSDTGRFQSVKLEFDMNLGFLYLSLVPLDTLESLEVNFTDTNLSTDLTNLLSRDLNEVVGFSRGDQISLSQLSEVKERILRKLKQRGFSKASAVLVLEESETEFRKNLILSIKLEEQDMISGLIFKGFSARDLKELRSVMETSEYVKSYFSKMDVPNDLLDRPENYLIEQIKREREANQGLPVTYELMFPFDQLLLNQSTGEWLQRIKKQGYFDASIESKLITTKGSSFFSIELVMGPRYNIQFKGNVNFWERDLRIKVLDRTMRVGLAFNENEALTLLKEMYYTDGFKDVEINLIRENIKNERRIVFEIKEGSRFYLGQVFWDGLSKEEQVILDEIVNKWRNQFSSPLHHIYFNEKLIKSQLPNLLELIKSRGYLQARFLGLRIKPVINSSQVPIEIPIQIGPRFTIRQILVEGFHSLDESKLNEIVNLEPGDIADSFKILELSKIIKSNIRNKSYLFVTVSEQLEEIITYSDSSDEVDVRYLVNSGPRIQLGQIVVEGLRKTKEKVILREFKREKMESGELWNPNTVEEIDQRLQSYGLFGNLRLQMVGGKIIERSEESSDGVELQERDLRISLVERPGGAIEFGPGYRTDLGIVGFGEFVYRNLGGKNRSVVLRSQISRKLENFQFFEQKYLFSYLEPYLFDLPLSLRFSTSYEKRDQYSYDKFNLPEEQSFNIEEVSASFVLGKDFNKNISLRHILYSISKPRNFDLKGQEKGGTLVYRIATMGPTLIFDYRDNIFNPKNGFLFSTSLEYAAPDLGSSDFVNFVLSKNDYSFYKQLSSSIVFALSFGYSRMENIDKDANLPLDRRLTLGGRTSIRSLTEKKVNFIDRDQVDMMNSYLMKLEMRQDLFSGLGFAYFFDMGRVDAKGYRGEGWREAIGVGMRYMTPVGPLSLDFAFNADPKFGEDLSRILFSVGVF